MYLFHLLKAAITEAQSLFHFPQVVVEGQQFGFDTFQALYHLKLLRHSVAVTPNKGLRSIQFQPFLFHQKVYHFYGFYVFRRVEPGVFLIPHGLDDGEFFFPKSKCAWKWGCSGCSPHRLSDNIACLNLPYSHS